MADFQAPGWPPIQRRITSEVAQAALARARLAMSEVSPYGKPVSRTLHDALHIRVHSETRLDLYVPHYWARIVHDGMSAREKRGGPPYIWYGVDRTRDPRPTHLERFEEHHLTTEEYARDKQLFFMSRRVSQVHPTPFFTRGMDGFASEASSLGLRILREELRSHAPWMFQVIRI